MGCVSGVVVGCATKKECVSVCAGLLFLALVLDKATSDVDEAWLSLSWVWVV